MSSETLTKPLVVAPHTVATGIELVARDRFVDVVRAQVLVIAKTARKTAVTLQKAMDASDAPGPRARGRARVRDLLSVPQKVSQTDASDATDASAVHLAPAKKRGRRSARVVARQLGQELSPSARTIRERAKKLGQLPAVVAVSRVRKSSLNSRQQGRQLVESLDEAIRTANPAGDAA